MGRKGGKEIENKLRELRARHRLTQAELAKAVGVSRQTIVAIEKGEYNPSVALALRMSAVFDESVNEMFWLASEKA